jgi:hypothetical protein
MKGEATCGSPSLQNAQKTTKLILLVLVQGQLSLLNPTISQNIV